MIIEQLTHRCRTTWHRRCHSHTHKTCQISHNKRVKHNRIVQHVEQREQQWQHHAHEDGVDHAIMPNDAAIFKKKLKHMKLLFAFTRCSHLLLVWFWVLWPKQKMFGVHKRLVSLFIQGLERRNPMTLQAIDCETIKFQCGCWSSCWAFVCRHTPRTPHARRTYAARMPHIHALAPHVRRTYAARTPQ